MENEGPIIVEPVVKPKVKRKRGRPRKTESKKNDTQTKEVLEKSVSKSVSKGKRKTAGSKKQKDLDKDIKISDEPMTEQEKEELDEIEEELKNTDIKTVTNSEKEIEDFCSKILKYCEVQAGIELYPYQREFGLEIIRCLVLNLGEELTGLFSRQSGKTEAVTVVLGGCMVLLPTLAKQMPGLYEIDMYKDGLWVGIFAPSNEQAFTAFSRLRDRIRSKNAQMILNDVDIQVELENEGKGNPLRLSNGSLCRMQSAAKQSQIESKSYHVVLVDEAQDCDSMKIRKSVHPMLAAYNGTIIKIGTPNTKRSDFYEAIRRNIRREQKYGARKYHFQNDYKTVQKYNPKYKKFIEKEIARLGYDSDEFRMAYRLHFILERGMFITQDELEEKVFDYKLKHQDSEMDFPCVVGIDWAKGSDSTVVTVLRVDYNNTVVDEFTGDEYPVKELVNWLELTGEDYERQFYEIVDWLKQFRVTSIFMDSTGPGDPISDRFSYYFSGHVHVEGYSFTRPSKSTMWKILNQEIKGGRVKVPAHSRTQRLRSWKRFRSQMLDLEKDYVGQYMVCQHPDVKGAHDDYCDSLALAVLASMSDNMPEIEVEDNPFFPTRLDADRRLFG